MTRPTCIRSLSAIALAIAVTFGAASAARADATTGGTNAFGKPDVTALKCGTGEQQSCPRGQVLRLSGENLAATRSVVFLGRNGTGDDRSARAQESSPHRVIVEVPTDAHSGPLRIVASRAAATGPSLKVLPVSRPAPAAVLAPVVLGTLANGGVFPIQGAHDYGTAINAFGGARNHQGQDVLAACRLPLVAALPGVVTLVRFQERAGNYIVIKAADGTSQVYMHMLALSPLVKGAAVVAGQTLGQVGKTGDATACHLHFEFWTAPGWYEGGTAVDPLPALRSWDTLAQPA